MSAGNLLDFFQQVQYSRKASLVDSDDEADETPIIPQKIFDERLFDEKLLSSKLVAYSLWKTTPSPALVSPALTVRQLRHILSRDIEIDTLCSIIPQIPEKLPKRVKIYPQIKAKVKLAKPDLLLIIATLFSKNAEKAQSIEGLVSSLDQYDFIASWETLSKILQLRKNLKANTERFKLYAFKTGRDSPIFLTLKREGKADNEGSVINQYIEQLLDKKDDIQVQSVRILSFLYSDLKVCLSSPTICTTLENGTLKPTLIVARPDWARRDNSQLLSTWLQCAASGIEIIHSAIYKPLEQTIDPESVPRTDMPVVFLNKNTKIFGCMKFSKEIKYKQEMLDYPIFALEHLKANIKDCGVVYCVSGRRGESEFKIDAAPEVEFPVSQGLLTAIACAILDLKGGGSIPGGLNAADNGLFNASSFNSFTSLSSIDSARRESRAH